MKSRTNKNEFAVVDIEAKNWIEYLCNGYYDGKNYKEFFSLFDFIDFLHHTKIKKIFAHYGGGYDFLFFLQAFLSDTESWEEPKLIPRGSTILMFTIKSKITKKIFQFCDSIALLPFALRTCAINFKVETLKGEIDYEKLDKITPELLQYMKDDHLALYQCLQKFFEWDLIKKHGSKVTIAGQALHIFKKEFLSKKIGSIPNLFGDYDAFVRKSYFGGRTEIFNLVYDNPKKELHCYDVNSLYPSVMENNDYPLSPKMKTKKFKKGELGFYHVKVFVPDMPIPPLGTKIKIGNTEKFIFPCGTFEGHWTEHELSYAISLGCKIIKVYEGLVFTNGGKIFKSYVNYFYKKRLSSKNEVDKIICKLFLNSLYGRFGMSLTKETITLENFKAGEKFHSTITDLNGEKHNFYTIEKEIETTSNVAITSYVTSYSRVKMHKLMVNEFKNRVWYTDTDSIFTDVKIKDSFELGDFKKEYSVNRACFLLPKTYLVESKLMKKVTMKGFDKKKIQNLSFNDFTNCLEGDLKLKNKLDKNKLKIKQDSKVMKFRSALKSGKLLGMTKSNFRKINSKYDKRIVLKDYSTKAHFIEN